MGLLSDFLQIGDIMENATQALLIGAGVLVGILILSLGVALMNIIGGYAANTQSQIDENSPNKSVFIQQLRQLDCQCSSGKHMIIGKSDHFCHREGETSIQTLHNTCTDHTPAVFNM